MPDRSRNDALLIVGAVVLVIGLALLGQSMGVYPPFVFQAIRAAGRASGPLALIVIGAIVILIASRGGFHPSVPEAGRRLYKSRDDKMIEGVAGGLAHYFGVDPLIVRLAFVALGLMNFWTALLVYIVLAVLVPAEPPAASEVQQRHA